MNLLFRLIYTLLFSRFRSRVPILGPCKTPFRCLPTDLDVLLHMNNGKYCSLMDIARVDLMIRSDLFAIVNRNKWYPVVEAETLRFRKSIQPFARFDIETQVIGWDEKAVLLEQNFIVKKQVYCRAIVRARFLKKSGGSVTSEELLQASKLETTPPALESWIENWNKEQSQK